MKKESVRKRESRDQIKNRAAQAAAAAGIAGGGTAVAATVLAGDEVEESEVAGQSAQMEAASNASASAPANPAASYSGAVPAEAAYASSAAAAASSGVSNSSGSNEEVQILAEGADPSFDAVNSNFEDDAVDVFVEEMDTAEAPVFVPASAVNGIYPAVVVTSEGDDGAFVEVDGGSIDITPIDQVDCNMACGDAISGEYVDPIAGVSIADDLNADLYDTDISGL